MVIHRPLRFKSRRKPAFVKGPRPRRSRFRLWLIFPPGARHAFAVHCMAASQPRAQPQRDPGAGHAPLLRGVSSMGGTRAKTAGREPSRTYERLYPTPRLRHHHHPPIRTCRIRHEPMLTKNLRIISLMAKAGFFPMVYWFHPYPPRLV